jgi:hypothetical protein
MGGVWAKERRVFFGQYDKGGGGGGGREKGRVKLTQGEGDTIFSFYYWWMKGVCRGGGRWGRHQEGGDQKARAGFLWRFRSLSMCVRDRAKAMGGGGRWRLVGEKRGPRDRKNNSDWSAGAGPHEPKVERATTKGERTGTMGPRQREDDDGDWFTRKRARVGENNSDWSTQEGPRPRPKSKRTTTKRGDAGSARRGRGGRWRLVGKKKGGRV